MCGIAGYHVAGAPADARRARAMADRLVHRGPDDHGVVLIDTRTGAAWAEDGAPGTAGAAGASYDLALAHRRLAVLDPSAAGHQPMASPDGRRWVVYNGEIYNYVELRDELARRGHAFRTGTDTEVLLAAYAEWGAGCLARFNGMWAFALWDADARQLFCARDRFGVKPLYYATGPGWFAFGSEIKALLAHPAVPRRPNAAAVYDFLALRLADHTDETFFDGIHRVPAAHALVYRPGAAPALRRYWDCRPAPRDPLGAAGEAHAIARFRELFDDAVRIRLRADVPVGTCLSGGVDSSSIVVTANPLLGARQRTFSACSEDPRFDERRFIDEVIAATGAASHRVFPSGARLWDELGALVDQMDEPFHSTSQYAQYAVMRLVREAGVTVTLDGQGADELMAGYPAYHGVYLATLLRAGRVGAAAREAAATWRLAGRGRSAAQLVARAAFGLLPAALAAPARDAAAALAPAATPEGRSLRVIRRAQHARFGERRAAWTRDRHAASSDLGARLYDDQLRFSLPCLLRYADRSSMAFSVESRMPMLDYRLAEHVAALPPSMIVRGGWTKWLLRRALDGRLPRAVQWRRDKLGFVTPEAIWLREGRRHLDAVFAGPLAAADVLDGAAIRAALADGTGADDNVFYTDVFRWYIVEVWMRRMFGTAA